MNRRRARAVVVGVAPVLLLVAGCGVGPQAHPVSLGTATPNWASTSGVVSGPPPPTAALQVSVFLVRDGKLAAAWRPSVDGMGLDAILATLVERPNRAEKAERLSTAIPAGATRIRATIRHHVALVQVPDGFNTLPNKERVLAVAQVLYTLTAQLPVTSLRLVKGKRLLDTPVGSGQLVSRPVTREDFAQLAPDIL